MKVLKLSHERMLTGRLFLRKGAAAPKAYYTPIGFQIKVNSIEA